MWLVSHFSFSGIGSHLKATELSTHYLAPTPETPPAAITPDQVPTGVDATASFGQKINDSSKWKVVSGVPVFKAHQRTDPNTQKLISVDLPKLYRIAENMQRMERQGGVPIRMTLGHTEPGKPETQQPPIAGYYRNARVQKFGPGGEPAIVVDEFLDPQFSNVRKNYPYRSSEYYDDTEQITGVALLTRDPFLDLGVVAYQKGDQSNLTYENRQTTSFVAHATEIPGSGQTNPSTGRTPVMYRLNLGEVPMYPQGAPQPNQFVPPPQQVPVAPQPTPYAAPVQQSDPQPVWGQTVPAPTPYAYPRPVSYWDGTQASGGNPPRPVPHQHQNTGAIYSQNGRGGIGRYADEPPMGGPPNAGPPGSEPGNSGPTASPLDQVRELLMQAAQVLADCEGGGMGGPGGPPMMASRTGGNARYGRTPSRPRLSPGARYETPRTPTQYTGATTISGMPVGVQMEMDKLKLENTQLKQGMNVLFYERDQADTHACIETVRSLQYQGFQVGEYEVSELKKKTPEERAAYVQHIATHYQQIGTTPLPQQLGDPTPAGAEPVPPMTKEHMQAALRATQGNNDSNAFIAAMTHYQRNGVPAGSRFTPPTVQPSYAFDQNPFEGQAVPNAAPGTNPYSMD